MEIAKAAIFHHTISPTKFNNLNMTSFQLQLPLNKPIYKKPEPIKLKPHKPFTTSTTSDVLRLMDSLKLPLPLSIYASLVKECTESGDPFKAIQLHKHIKKSGLRLNLPFLNRVLLMYVSNGCFQEAHQLFDQMPVRDFNSWAVVIGGCVENGEYNAGKALFARMLCGDCIKFDDFDRRLVSGLLVCVLRGCLRTEDLELGRQVHGWLLKMGFSSDVALSSYLISFYGKLRCLEDAESVFKHVGRRRNTVVWTSRIVNCCSESSNFEEAVSVFKEMGREGVRMNGYTFSSMLKACGRIEDIWCGRQIHANVMKLGLESDGFVQCALVDFYGKCGALKDATMMFDMGGITRNSASCNAILTNYAQNGLCKEAMKILYEMKLAGFKPNESSFSEVNLVCGGISLENKIDF